MWSIDSERIETIDRYLWALIEWMHVNKVITLPTRTVHKRGGWNAG